ncbi:hypothetical protein ACCO45_001486 [Purpureocillium lilacinum]|uniref:Uncharacterized protein n=1 Tax=Purpureocillium lilacinum TaxID=33203 RepID=A0ACC4E8B3_PURLI
MLPLLAPPRRIAAPDISAGKCLGLTLPASGGEPGSGGLSLAATVDIPLSVSSPAGAGAAAVAAPPGPWTPGRGQQALNIAAPGACPPPTDTLPCCLICTKSAPRSRGLRARRARAFIPTLTSPATRSAADAEEQTSTLLPPELPNRARQAHHRAALASSDGGPGARVRWPAVAHAHAHARPASALTMSSSLTGHCPTHMSNANNQVSGNQSPMSSSAVKLEPRGHGGVGAMSLPYNDWVPDHHRHHHYHQQHQQHHHQYQHQQHHEAAHHPHFADPSEQNLRLPPPESLVTGNPAASHFHDPSSPTSPAPFQGRLSSSTSPHSSRLPFPSLPPKFAGPVRDVVSQNVTSTARGSLEARPPPTAPAIGFIGSHEQSLPSHTDHQQLSHPVLSSQRDVHPHDYKPPLAPGPFADASQQQYSLPSAPLSQVRCGKLNLRRRAEVASPQADHQCQACLTYWGLEGKKLSAASASD